MCLHQRCIELRTRYHINCFRADSRYINKGTNKRIRYTTKEKYDIIDSYDEMVASKDYLDINTVSKYLLSVYINEETAHNYVSQYGKWNKTEIECVWSMRLLGKISTARRNIPNLHFTKWKPRYMVIL